MGGRERRRKIGKNRKEEEIGDWEGGREDGEGEEGDRSEEEKSIV